MSIEFPTEHPLARAKLRAPFPWFGGKSRAASLIWEAFGDVSNYVEPFAGSLAVLLGRPTAPRIETVNDLDCYLANWWRAVQREPGAVARWADGPVNEADLHARHRWLVDRADFRARMLADPEHYDVQVAGWWVWGLSAWLGSGWCSPSRASSRQVPFLAHSMGVHRSDLTVSLQEWFGQLARRLRATRVVCGDWSRVLTSTVLKAGGGVTGVVLDPPYLDGAMDYAAGGVGTDLSATVRAWAIEHGDDRSLRVALCGYEGEHSMPADWRVVEWKAVGGYGSGAGNDNCRRERVWFSPGCLQPQAERQRELFGAAR